MRADLYRSGPRVNAGRWSDGCQRPGLRGRTPTLWTACYFYLITKEKFILLLCLSVKLTQMLYVPRVGKQHPFFCGKANASGPAYFCNLEGTNCKDHRGVRP